MTDQRCGDDSSAGSGPSRFRGYAKSRLTLTGIRAAAIFPDEWCTAAPTSKDPLYRLIAGVDAKGSTGLTNPEKGLLREIMYPLVHHALARIGLDERHRVSILDRGDGVLILIPPYDHVPKTRLLDTFLPVLRRGLLDHGSRNPHQSFRLRAMVHAGEVHYHNDGWYGNDLDVGCRLLDATELKQILQRTTSSLAYAVSGHIYSSIVCHGYRGIDKEQFHRITVATAAGPHEGWVHIPPGHDGHVSMAS
jgi:hypothetical protein